MSKKNIIVIFYAVGNIQVTSKCENVTGCVFWKNGNVKKKYFMYLETALTKSKLLLFVIVFYNSIHQTNLVAFSQHSIFDSIIIDQSTFTWQKSRKP